MPKVFGAEAVVWAIAALGGPVLSGFLTEAISWRAAFAVNLPIGAIFIALVLAVVPKQHQKPQNLPRIPIVRLLLVGAAIVIVSIASLIIDPVMITVCLVAAGFMLFAVVMRDRGAAQKLFPTNAFSLKDPVGAGLWVILLMPVAQSGGTVYLILALQELWGFGPTVAGLIGASMSVSWSAFAIAVAGVKTHKARMGLIRLGPALLALGMLGLGIGIQSHTFWLVLISQISVGAGFGMSWAYLSQTIMENARHGERDTASALLPTIQSAGYGIGAAIAGLAANSAGLAVAQTIDGVLVAMIAVFGLGAVLSILGLVAAFAMTRAVPDADSARQAQ